MIVHVKEKNIKNNKEGPQNLRLGKSKMTDCPADKFVNKKVIVVRKYSEPERQLVDIKLYLRGIGRSRNLNQEGSKHKICKGCHLV